MIYHIKVKEKMKAKNKRNYLRENGITLIALVVTIVVLLILAGVSVNALFGNSGIIEKAKEAQNKMDKATENDQKEIGELTNWIDNQVNGTTGGNNTTNNKLSALVGTVVDKNTKVEDAYGNKITIPKGFKIVAHGTAAGSATYTYSGNNIPAVQDGIVIENGTDGNQFVWVPVGTIKNKNNTTNTITLGRYSNFAKQNGTYVPAQNANNYTQEVAINTNYKELSTFRAGNTSTGSSAQNATARDLKSFVETTLANGGYYIARFEASGTTSKITSKYSQTVLESAEQSSAATLAREMYGEVKENNELVYASDLINSYAWDTAIIFIQTYSTVDNASNYANQYKGNAETRNSTGLSDDKYCNIWDMSGNAYEWTTESYISTGSSGVGRGGCNVSDSGDNYNYTSFRTELTGSRAYFDGLRAILYVM